MFQAADSQRAENTSHAAEHVFVMLIECHGVIRFRAELRMATRGEEAFEELFARYRQPLYGFFRRRLESRERAEDLTQETFLAVIRATSRYEPRALVRTYLYGIALKLAAAERRKQTRNSPLPLLET